MAVRTQINDRLYAIVSSSPSVSTIAQSLLRCQPIPP
jgi:hypothetical protein